MHCVDYNIAMKPWIYGLGRVIALILLLVMSTAQADEPPSWGEFEIFSSNGKYVAKVRAKDRSDGPYPYDWDYAIEVFDTKKHGKPLWYSEYYYDGYSGGILSDDGSTFVYVSFWYYAEDVVVSIYREERRMDIKGNKFKVKPSSLMKTVSHRIWLSDEAPNYRFVTNDGTLVLEVNTRDGRRHLIDVKSGRFLG